MDIVVLVEVKGVSGVKVLGLSGVRIDFRGYIIFSYFILYMNNFIFIDLIMLLINMDIR